MSISSTHRPLYLACLLSATTFAAQGAWAQTYSQPPQDKEKKSTHQHATVNEKAKAGQGHLHYQVDDDPIVATTAKKLSFHALSSGKHTIKVVLAGNDHSPLGPEQTLDVNIP
jgi:hypothetical protein